METAAIYARVSTDDQAREGVSLDAQISRAMAYCEERALSVVETIVETVSAKDVEHRPGLKRILQMVDRGKVRHVVAWKFDRVARNTSDSLKILQLFVRRGAQVHEVCEQTYIRTNTADDEFLFTLKASLAARERRLIGERTALAMQRKKELGHRVSRFAPFGYQFDGDRVIEEPGEQAIIRTVHRLAETGLSIRKISTRLAEDGLLNRRGRPFGVAELHKLLRRNERQAA